MDDILKDLIRQFIPFAQKHIGFEILIDNLDSYKKRGYTSFISVSSDHQMDRLISIFKILQLNTDIPSNLVHVHH